MNSTILQVEESKNERPDVEMSNAQEAFTDQIEQLIDDDGQTRRSSNPRESAASAATSKKKKPPGSYYRNLQKDKDSQLFAGSSRGVSQSSVD